MSEDKKKTTRSISILGQIQSMSVADKISFVLHAGKEARSILIRDPNRLVAMTVLASPKITEDEIYLIAQSRNVSDDILKTIAKNKEWVKKYPICLALVNNPKTPLHISSPLLPMIKGKDLGLLGKNRNVAQAIRTSALRLMKARQQS